MPVVFRSNLPERYEAQEEAVSLTRDELIDQLTHYRDTHLAQWVLIALQLVVEKYPEEVRQALTLVFDQRQVEDYLLRIAQETGVARVHTEATRELFLALNTQLDDLERKLDRRDAQIAALDKKIIALTRKLENKNGKQTAAK